MITRHDARTVILCALLTPAGAASLAAGPSKVHVYILAGQSNMEGKAKVQLLEHQVQQPATRDLFKHYEKDGEWVERDDVWIKFLDRHGKLTVGYGSPGCIGPELELGHVLGDRHEEPVLLIKTAWGGRSLYRDFRSPSAGLPPQAALETMLAGARKKTPEATLDEVKAPFGAAYWAMLEEVAATLARLNELFPGYQGQEHELAGFFWFQGWNDMISAEATAEYTTNLAHFIRDVRKDLKAPGLPFVVAQMGVDGLKASKEIERFKAAQAAILDVPEFRSNVALVKTDVFWDLEAEAVFKKGWREHLDEWNKVGSDWPYHYLGSARTLCAIGKAMGEAVIGLREAAEPVPLSVMTFNLWVGGEAGKQPLEQTVRVIRAARADVAGLQETGGLERNGARPDSSKKIADLLDWSHLDQGGGRAIISRHRIVEPTPRRWGAKIALREGGFAFVFNAHLAHAPYQPYQLLGIPYNDGPFIKTAEEAVRFAREARGGEVQSLVDELKPALRTGFPVFLTGDLNEPSHLDWTEAAAKAGRCPLAVEWPSTKALTEAGLADALRAARPDPIRDPAHTWTPTTRDDDPKDRHDRIDFVFFARNAKPVEVELVGEAEGRAQIVVTPYPSDHRAVVARFKVSRPGEARPSGPKPPGR